MTTDVVRKRGKALTRWMPGARGSRAAVLAFVAIASLVVAAPGGAGVSDQGDGSQNAVATGGWLSTGGSGLLKDPRGGTYGIWAMIVFPDGTAEGAGPQTEGEPDLRKPWVAVVEESTDAAGWEHTNCVSLGNVPASAYRNAGPGQMPEVAVDVTCNDGRGFDFYRLHWRATEPVVFGAVDSAMLKGPFQLWFAADHPYDQPHYAGGVEWATFRSQTSTRATFSICGHRGSQVECLAPEGQTSAWRNASITGGWNSLRMHAGRVQRTTCC